MSSGSLDSSLAHTEDASYIAALYNQTAASVEQWLLPL